MSGPNRPGDIPPDLPPEYAEAYRRGFNSAFTRDTEAEETTRLDSLDSAFRPVPAGDRQARPIHRDPDEDERRKFLAPLLLVGLALLLVLSAYGLGRIFSSEVGDADTSAPEPNGIVLDEGDATPDEAQPSKGPKQKKRYDGRVDAAPIGSASASCQSPGSVDSTGRRVGYKPSNIYDGDMSTAWRCDGTGVGQRVTIELPEQTTVGEVGLVPGYAKTDAASGADRYAENNRITRVRWLFSDGSSVTQKLNGSPTNRDLQTMRIPKSGTNQVIIEILGSTRGPRNTVAISEVWIGAAAG